MLERAHEIQQQLANWRREFHMRPELGFHETSTAARVAEITAALGYRVRTGVGRTGVVAERGEGPPVVAIRADMDALPIQDAKDVPYASRIPNVMHACGHDAHTAILRGVARRRVAVRGGEEVGELSQAFNHMGESLQQAESLRRDMTADIAHELRNPLSVMQARVEAVIDGVYPPTAEHLQPVLEQTRLLSRLVEDLRTLALADAGQLALDRQEIDLAGVVGRTVIRRLPGAGASCRPRAARPPGGRCPRPG